MSLSPQFGSLIPSQAQELLNSNYLQFNAGGPAGQGNGGDSFAQQYLPEVYEQEVERYGNRTISGFLRMVGAEMPSNSDLIKWAEQGRLHTKYVDVVSGAAAASLTATLTINDVLVPGSGGIAIRVGQTIMLSDSSLNSTNSNKAIVTAVDTALGTVDVAYYEAAGQSMAAGVQCSLFIYGSEFQKGAIGMEGQLEADDFIFENSPIIIKDRYAVSGSDMAQIGWIEVTTENGATGYLWYLKSEHETRLRFEVA